MSRGKKQIKPKISYQPVQFMLETAINKALADLSLPLSDPQLRPDQTLKFGDWVSPIALGLAKAEKENPLNIAQKIASSLKIDQVIVTVTPPGYLNFSLTPGAWQKTLQGVLDNKFITTQPENILVELVSANPTGALTVGSARNAIWGDSLARLLANTGNTITREYYVNDAGNQVLTYAKSLRAHALGLEVPEGGYQGVDAKEIAQELLDIYHFNAQTPIKIWQEKAIELTLGKIKADLSLIGVSIDRFKSEQSLHQAKAIDRVLEKLTPYLYKQDGATYLSTTKWGDDKDRVVVRTNNEPTYFAADIAYLDDKFARHYDRLIYVLGVDHGGYAARMKAAACCLGHNPDKVDIKLYELVTIKGSKGGKRLGNMPSVKEALNLTSQDALRWYLLSSSANQTIDLDLEKMGQQTLENPVYYVQYAHARACSLKERASVAGINLPAKVCQSPATLSVAERRLAIMLAQMPIILSDAAKTSAVHNLPTHLLELARAHSNFYTKLPVLPETDLAKQQWLLSLHLVSGQMLKRGLNLMGISAPNKM